MYYYIHSYCKYCLTYNTYICTPELFYNFLTQEIAKEAWDKYLLRNRSVVVSLFQGQYKSTLVCPTCKKVCYNTSYTYVHISATYINIVHNQFILILCSKFNQHHCLSTPNYFPACT